MATLSENSWFLILILILILVLLIIILILLGPQNQIRHGCYTIFFISWLLNIFPKGTVLIQKYLYSTYTKISNEESFIHQKRNLLGLTRNEKKGKAIYEALKLKGKPVVTYILLYSILICFPINYFPVSKLRINYFQRLHTTFSLKGSYFLAIQNGLHESPLTARSHNIFHLPNTLTNKHSALHPKFHHQSLANHPYHPAHWCLTIMHPQVIWHTGCYYFHICLSVYWSVCLSI